MNKQLQYTIEMLQLYITYNMGLSMVA